MIKLNPKEVLARAAERAAEVKPLPKVRVVSSPNPFDINYVPAAKSVTKPKPPAPPKTQLQQLEVFPEKDILLKELWEQLTVIKKDRAKLSSATALLVDQLYERLKLDSQAEADAFMNGDLPMPDLADHYAAIQAFTDQAIIIWDQIRYAEQYGKLPEVPTLELPQSNPDEDAIRHEIRRLDDLIHKCSKKIEQANGGLKKPKNNERVNTWKEKISLAEARRDQLKHNLKTKQYDARAKRVGEE